MAASERQRRRLDRELWQRARSRVQTAASSLASAGDIVAANHELIAAVDEWERSRSALERRTQDLGWLARLAHRRRMRRDDRLRAAVQTVIARRKRASHVVRSRSQDLPAHDWLKDAWR